MNRHWVAGIVVAALLLMGMVKPLLAQEPEIGERLQSLAAIAHEGLEAAQRADAAAMQHEYDEIHEAWEAFEDEVRERDPSLYVELESALDAVKDAVNQSPTDATAAAAAYDHLFDELTIAATHSGSGATGATIQAASVPEVLAVLDAALAALQQGNGEEAARQLRLATQAWPTIEGTVATKSQSDYSAIENDLGSAVSALRATPADLAGATASLTRVRATLAPYANPQSYSAFDAAAVILREGLEALLVVVALLALLQRSGNKHKQGWVWAGVGLGVLVSIGTGFAFQILFNQVSAGQNRELIEGITGLVAAVLLIYISYWLHSKSSIVAWQKYIQAQTTQALARGSMWGLATLAFLTVFREGAETTLFYMGMAPAISTNDLLLGLVLGVAVLIVAAILMLVMGVRLPIRLFFQVGGLLVYYLGFKFLGKGVHALQVAGVLPTTPIPFLPEIPFFGIYPTWQTLAPQLLLLAVATGMVWYLRVSEAKPVATPVRPTTSVG